MTYVFMLLLRLFNLFVLMHLYFGKDIQRKVDELQALYDKVKSETDDRNKNLEETLGVSEKFWDDVAGVSDALKELEDNLVTEIEEPVPLEVKSIIEQQQALQVCMFM